MFNVGDKVVYPMHGAGIIEAIEEKEILGATKKYYVMKLPVGDMKVMIPMDCSNQVGLREVVCDGGLLFEAGNVSQLASLLRRLSDDGLLRKQGSAQAATRAAAFGIERTAERYTVMYRELIRSV